MAHLGSRLFFFRMPQRETTLEDLIGEKGEVSYKEKARIVEEEVHLFLDELIKNKPDQKLLENLALEKLALMQEFMRDLSPEQRQKLVEIISKRFSPSRQTTSPPAE